MNYVRFIERQTGNKLKCLFSDNGTEFVNKKLDKFFERRGIVHETSAPYCPEANGRIEREIRTVKEGARTLLLASHLDEKFWADAVATTVYTLNRVLTKQCPEKTAHEIIFKQKPSLQHMRVFGSVGYVHIPRENRTVWNAKAKKCILVGYQGKKYRVFVEETGKIYHAKNVVFVEKDEEVNFPACEHEEVKEEKARGPETDQSDSSSDEDSSTTDDDGDGGDDDYGDDKDSDDEDDSQLQSFDSDLMTEDDELRLHIDPSEMITEDETMDEVGAPEDVEDVEEDEDFQQQSTSSSSADEGKKKPLTLKTPDGTFRYKLVPVPGTSKSKIAIEHLSDGEKGKKKSSWRDRLRDRATLKKPSFFGAIVVQEPKTYEQAV